MPNPMGVSWQPGGDSTYQKPNEQGRALPAGSQGPAKLFSLRLPNRSASPTPAPWTLLQGGGSAAAGGDGLTGFLTMLSRILSGQTGVGPSGIGGATAPFAVGGPSAWARPSGQPAPLNVGATRIPTPNFSFPQTTDGSTTDYAGGAGPSGAVRNLNPQAPAPAPAGPTRGNTIQEALKNLGAPPLFGG